MDQDFPTSKDFKNNLNVKNLSPKGTTWWWMPFFNAYTRNLKSETKQNYKFCLRLKLTYCTTIKRYVHNLDTAQ